MKRLLFAGFSVAMVLAVCFTMMLAATSSATTPDSVGTYVSNSNGTNETLTAALTPGHIPKVEARGIMIQTRADAVIRTSSITATLAGLTINSETLGGVSTRAEILVATSSGFLMKLNTSTTQTATVATITS